MWQAATTLRTISIHIGVPADRQLKGLNRQPIHNDKKTKVAVQGKFQQGAIKEQ